MTDTYVLEHVVRYEGSHIIDLYDTWDALVYGVSQHYPAPADGTDLSTEAAAALLTVDESDGYGAQWSTPGYGLGDEEHLRVTKKTVKTATKALFEVRVRSTINGNLYDRVIRGSDGISDEGHANGLAAGWNAEPPVGMEDGAEFYVNRIN
jgi:hypothetical protein